ncbi:MAG: hypothetical protein IPQ01_17945 [Zoogloea sp.]|nr:hypothetical protein [Zoogloea sp.]
MVALRHIRHVMIKDDELIIIDWHPRRRQWCPRRTGARGIPPAQGRGRARTLKLKRLKSMRAATLDGEEVQILANIKNFPDAVQAKAVEADGVGLFRTEVLFMVRHLAGRRRTVRGLQVRRQDHGPAKPGCRAHPRRGSDKELGAPPAPRTISPRPQGPSASARPSRRCS